MTAPSAGRLISGGRKIRDHLCYSTMEIQARLHTEQKLENGDCFAVICHLSFDIWVDVAYFAEIQACLHATQKCEI